MGLFDSDSSDEAVTGLSNLAYAINTSNTLSGQTGLLDSIGDAVTKFVPLTALSAANSFYNTGVAVSNFFGADAAPVKAQDELKSLGWDDYENYYTQHEQGIEAAGLIAGSFIPGGAAIKAVKAVQGGLIGSVAARATNLLMPATKDVIEATEATIMRGNSALFPSLTADKLRAVGYGLRDQFVQNIAFETAAAATMAKSPLLTDQSYTDMATDSLYGVAFATGVGGLIEGYSIWSKFNRAYVAASEATRESRGVTLFFDNNKAALNGAPLAGDKATGIWSNIWEGVPVLPDNNLSARTASATERSQINDAYTATRALAGTGNADFADAVSDMIMRGKNSGSMTVEDMAEKLARLKYIQPVGDDSLVSPTTDIFYVHQYANPTQPLGWTDLVTPAPVKGADVSRKFVMREMATEGPVLGRYDDPFTTVTGETVGRYADAKEAFDDGVDLFLNRRGQISVNPNAPNIREIPLEGFNRVLSNQEARVFNTTGMLPKDAAPLFSTPQILNVKTGDFVTDAVKTLGDYAGPAAVRVRNNGVAFGQNEFSLQTASLPLTAQTETTDAMARYLWWDRRGISSGDTIADGTVGKTADLPALEAMYNEARAAPDEAVYFSSLQKKGVTLESGAPLPSTAADLLNRIQIAKDNFIKDAMSTNPQMGAEEIARRANVSPDYIANNFQTSNSIDFMQPQKNISDINHVQLAYDVGNTSRINGNLVKGMQAVQYRMQLYQDAANTAMADFFGEQWQNFTASHYKSTDATVQGTKPGFLTFSNGEYGTVENRMEFIGRNVEARATAVNDKDAAALTPHFMGMRGDPDAAGEWNAFVAVRHMTGENYTFLPPEIAAVKMADAADPNNIAVLTKSLIKDRRGNITDWNENYIPQGFYPGATKASMEALEKAPIGGYPAGLRTFYELHPAVADLERAWQDINDRNVMARNKWYAAQGLDRELPVGNLYAPPIDTGKYPFFAIVKPVAGRAFADGSTAVITAASREALEQKVALLKDDFDVYYKDDIKNYKQIQGEYDYSRNFNTGLANQEMQRRGVLNDIFPNVNTEATIKDYIDFNRRQNYGLIRDHVELGSDQFFTELRAIGDNYVAPATSQVKWWSSMYEKTAENPYNSYINTALAIRDQSYTLWRDAQERLESYASSAFNAARSVFISTQKNLMSYEDASAMLERMGLGNPYGKAVDALKAYNDLANQLPPTRVLTRFVNAMNSIQAYTAIRLDGFQSLITAVSAPIMQLTELYNLGKKLAIDLPNTNGQVQLPGTIKLLAQGIGDYFNSTTRNQWMPWLRENNIMKGYSSEFFRLVDESTLPMGAAATESNVLQKIKNAAEIAGKIPGAQLSEDFVRYTAAMSAKRLFEAAGVTGSDLLDNITTFVNRIHGNYVASQRPIAFQGPVGAAMSLFQTYQINLFQQLLRYVADGDKKTMGLFAALQGGMYGVQGLPGVQFVNQALIGNASMNPAHKDIYSTTMNALGPELADWLLYGAVSNVTRVGLYTRGDINPRSLSIIPTNPLEFPAISGAINFMTSLFKTSQRFANGADVWTTITQGLEHNGLSRPLSGLGQLMQGYATTGTGAMVSLVNPSVGDGAAGWSDIQAAANFGRLLGARPLDEAVVMDTLFRSQAYTARDATRMEQLGSALKTWAVGNKPMPPEVVNDFATQYASSGGQMQNFAKFIVSQTKQANTARGNEIFMHLAKPLAQQMQMAIGGQRLPDYYTAPNTNPADVTPTNVGGAQTP